jgi:tRNA C32,U32 (ribose-2'-O)-methylase TrmJ
MIQTPAIHLELQDKRSIKATELLKCAKKDEVTLDLLLFNLSHDKSQAFELLHKVLNEPLLSDEEYNWLKQLLGKYIMG